MRIIADLHVHSKYSRATSRMMTLENIACWAKIKGINLIGTGDFTHPAQLASIEESLKAAGNGLFAIGNRDDTVRFMLTTEVCNIYSQYKKVRKIHTLILAPTIEAVKRMNSSFAKLGNINSDGRPIFGFSAKKLLKIVMDASPDCMLIPAHAWTPWFSIFGSKSGFDSVEECFGDYSQHIHAIETGLSSDPRMNWRLSSLDNITLVSNSDAHSPQKLGREANVFNCAMDYYEIREAIKGKDRDKFLFTIEYFSEEGKYHYDGHRKCGIMFSPQDTKSAQGKCPVCGRAVTVGVMNRLDRLADRVDGFIPENAVPFIHAVPLQEIISESFHKGINTLSVKNEYKRMISEAGSEFTILLDMSEKDISQIAHPRVAEAIKRVRAGELTVVPGFDGKFGRVRIFQD